MSVTMLLAGETWSTIMVFHTVFLSVQILDLFLCCLHVNSVHKSIDELWIMQTILLCLQHDTPAWLSNACLPGEPSHPQTAVSMASSQFLRIRTLVCLETEMFTSSQAATMSTSEKELVARFAERNSTLNASKGLCLPFSFKYIYKCIYLSFN